MGIVSSKLHWKTWIVIAFVVLFFIWILSSIKNFNLTGESIRESMEERGIDIDELFGRKDVEEIIEEIKDRELYKYLPDDKLIDIYNTKHEDLLIDNLLIDDLYLNDNPISIRECLSSGRLSEYVDITSVTGVANMISTGVANMISTGVKYVDEDLKYINLEPDLPEHIQKLTKFLERKGIKDSTKFKAVIKNGNIEHSRGNFECKAAMEKMFGVPFKLNTKPDWLRNPKTNRCLEIDVYNEDLKIGVEYHGPHHYNFPNRFNRNDLDKFIYSCYKDNIKLDICDENSVYVITVPYTVRFDLIEEFIRYYIPENFV